MINQRHFKNIKTPPIFRVGDQCCNCEVFVVKIANLEDRVHEQIYYGNVYCADCKPPIVFDIDIIGLDNQKLQIAIPKGKEWGICTNYFYLEVSLQLGIEEQRLTSEYRRNTMICPIEDMDRRLCMIVQ